MAPTLLAALVVLFRSPASVADDSRLGKPVSLQEVTRSLESVAKDFAGATGVPLSVATAIRDRKVTLIFHGRPAREAMAALADTLFLDWKPQGSGYTLVLNDAAGQDERKQADFEAGEARKAIARLLRQKASYEGATYEDLRGRYDDARRRLADAEAAKAAPDAIAALKAEVDDFMDPTFVAIARSIGDRADDVAESLAEGKDVFLSNVPNEPAIPLAAALLPPLFANGNRFGWFRMRVRLRFDPTAFALEASQSGTANNGIPARSETSLALDAPDPGPLERRLKAWAQTADPAVLEKRLDAASADFPDPGYRARLASVSEHLEFLAKAADVPVVGDAFRLAASPLARQAGATVGEYLRALDETRISGLSLAKIGATRTQNGWLMVRHARYWRRLPAEIPERLLEPGERIAEKGGVPGVDDFAALAESLSAPQENALAPGSRRIPVLARFSLYPLRVAGGELRLWNALDPSQRERATGAGLDVSALGAALLPRLRDALSDRAWRIGLVEEPVWDVLDGKTPPAGLTFALTLDPERQPPNDVEAIDLSALGISPPPNAPPIPPSPGFYKFGYSLGGKPIAGVGFWP